MPKNSWSLPGSLCWWHISCCWLGLHARLGGERPGLKGWKDIGSTPRPVTVGFPTRNVVIMGFLFIPAVCRYSFFFFFFWGCIQDGLHLTWVHFETIWLYAQSFFLNILRWSSSNFLLKWGLPDWLKYHLVCRLNDVQHPSKQSVLTSEIVLGKKEK